MLGGGRIFFNNTYGQTETGTGWTSSMVGMTPTKPGSCGHPLPGYKAEVVDLEGVPVPDGTLGVLTLAAPFPSLVRGVWGDPQRYVSTYFARYPGRYNVILRAGAEATPELAQGLINRIAAELGSFAKPSRVVFTPTLPRTRSGKIMRRLLRDLAREGTVHGDLSALENPDAIETIRELLRH